jgi:hypothetical protein
MAIFTHFLAVALGIIAGILLTKRIDATLLKDAHEQGRQMAVYEAGLRAKARGRKAAATRRQRKADP